MNKVVNFVDQSIVVLGTTVETIGNIVEILLITKKAAIEIDNISNGENDKNDKNDKNNKVLLIKNVK